ncbi:unnamed protein product [Musa acuminata subsp. burmannicoides]
MICAISGEVPEEPVVSKKSGLLFERRLIEHHIASHGKCPVTKEDLTTDDLVPVKTNKVVKPRPLQAASIPGLLGMFQNEWDALMLSNFALEQQLHTARQELSHALYQLSCVVSSAIVASMCSSFHCRRRGPQLHLPLLNTFEASSAQDVIVHSFCHHRRHRLKLFSSLLLFQGGTLFEAWFALLVHTDVPIGCRYGMYRPISMYQHMVQWGILTYRYVLLVLVSRWTNMYCLYRNCFVCINFQTNIFLETLNLEFTIFLLCNSCAKSLEVPSFVLYIVLAPCWSDHFCSTNCIILQHDAACRVIARLKKERDEARVLLAQAERQIPLLTASAANATTIVSNGKRAAEDELGPDGKRIRPGINPAIIAELTECNALLSGQRKKRQIPATLASVDALERSTQISSHPLHKTNKPGILSIDIDASKDMIATGGFDTNGVLFNRTSGQILSTLAGHSKKVTSVKFVPGSEVIVTGSSDKTVRVWQGTEDGSYDCRHILRDHTAEVQAVTVHATQKYFVTASMDSTWCFYDLSTGSCLTQVGEASTEEGFTSASFHPDGLILGTGTTGAIVKIWDVKSQSNVAKFDGHVGSVTAMSFSENGYFLATAAMDGVKLWDLRKLRNFRSFAPYDPNTPTNSVEFDFSGSYLAIAGSDTRVYQVANVKLEWNLIKTFPDLSGTGKVTCVKFGADAKYMAVGSMDRNLRMFGLPGDDSEEPRSPDN